MEKHFAQVGITAKEVHKVLVDGGQEDHFEFTKGQVKEKTLRAMGHPFAREGNASRGNQNRKLGRRSIAALPINEQTGALRQSFRRHDVGGKDLVTRMSFDTPYAKFVLSPTGTRKMIARGFYTSGGKLGIIRKRHKLRLAVAKKVYRQSIKKV
jgi:hypothetical protein